MAISILEACMDFGGHQQMETQQAHGIAISAITIQ